MGDVINRDREVKRRQRFGTRGDLWWWKERCVRRGRRRRGRAKEGGDDDDEDQIDFEGMEACEYGSGLPRSSNTEVYSAQTADMRHQLGKESNGIIWPPLEVAQQDEDDDEYDEEALTVYATRRLGRIGNSHSHELKMKLNFTNQR